MAMWSVGERIDPAMKNPIILLRNHRRFDRYAEEYAAQRDRDELRAN